MKKLLAALLLAFAAASPALHGAHFAIQCGKYKVLISNGGTPYQFSYAGTILAHGVSYTIQLPPQDGKVRYAYPNTKFDKTVSIKVTRDGEEVKTLAGIVSGKEVKVVRTGKCENIRTTLTTVVTEKNITFSTQFETEADQEIIQLYAVTIAWDTHTADWIAKMQNESFTTGKFESKNAFHLHRTNQRTLWYAVLIPGKKIGAVAVPDDETAMAGGIRFWDRALPNQHQMIYQPIYPKMLKAKFKTVEHKMTVTGFSASPETFKAEAEKIAEAEE